MKVTIILTLLALIALANSHQQLRRHELPFLDSMNPLQMAEMMSGDYTAILPEFLRPMARKVLGIEQSGTSAMLSQASSLFGGSGSGSNGGMLGGLGDLFGKANKEGEDNGVLGSFSNAFGGSNSGGSGFLSGLMGGSNDQSSNGGIMDSIKGKFGF